MGSYGSNGSTTLAQSSTHSSSRNTAWKKTIEGKAMNRKRTTTDPTQMKASDHSSDRTQVIVDTILARLTQLQPTHDVGQDDTGQPGDFARQVIEVFRDGVANTA